MNLPRITVVTPSFNQGQFLEQTVRSVLDQNYPNLEYFICDGGSTDQSPEIIRKYADRLDWWYSEKDGGQPDALNRGFSRASGDLVTFINSDDILYPGSLMAAAQAYLDGHAWIMGWVLFVEADGGEWPQLPEPYLRRIDWFHCNPISQQGTFWAGRLLKEVGLFRQDLQYSFDYEYWMRLVFQANLTPHLLRKCMATYRLHENSKTVALSHRQKADFRIIRDEYWRYLSPDEQATARKRRRRWEAQQLCLTGWNAMKQGDRLAARENAREALRFDRLSVDALRLMYCAMRGK